MSLSHSIALVAGATRGVGRGIAVALGERGATVYCTGRSVRGGLASGPERPETIDETAELVTAAGGRGIAVRCDHTDPVQVAALVERIRGDHDRLDILVNDVWGGDALTQFGTPFWELDLEKGRLMLERAVHSHIVTSRLAVPLMLAHQGGLVVEVTDGDSPGYRGNLYYDLVKSSVIRLAMAMAFELRHRGIAAVAVTPGFLRSEAMLDHFGVTEANWRDAGARDPNFLASETPRYAGRGIAALADDADRMRLSGRVLSSWALSDEYGVSDLDGSRPHWGRHFAAAYRPYRVIDEAACAQFRELAEIVFPDWPAPPREG
jgi:NAD(P)-dependent dehydrogenase (short-subunit alcohol dehydrogenase family)